MIKHKEIEQLTLKLSDLLREGGLINKSNFIRSIVAKFDLDPRAAAREILSLYGGAGSLSDIVLYAGNKPLIEENNELDSVRKELHRLCVNTVSG